MSGSNTEKLVERVVEIVLKRLMLPRVGLLSFSSGLPDAPDCEAFNWVLYSSVQSDLPLGKGYSLSCIKAPEDEGRTLSLLAVPECPRALAAELMNGFPVSPEGRLIFGCLGFGVPVFLDASPFDCCRSWAGSPFGADAASRLKRLESWGVKLLEAAASCEGASEPCSEKVLTVSGGWVTWSELSGNIAGVTAVRLMGGARLTDEAKDRLLSYGVNIL